MFKESSALPPTGEIANPEGVSRALGARTGKPAASSGESAFWTWLALAASVLWIALLLVQVMSHRGWPGNHDGLAPVSRMAALLGQWQAGHWIPVWSTHQHAGFGSPMPILYHKLHMYLSTAVLAVTGHTKTALVLPVALFMFAGMVGMVFCLRQFLGGRHRMLQWVVAGMLPATNYAVTDWLVRGALAEFAAMMVLPWVFGWCARLMLRGVWDIWIGCALGLLALAHSTLGLFSLVPLSFACVLAAVRWRKQVLGWIRPMAASALLGLLLVAPFALPMAAMAQFNRIERLSLAPIFVPRTNLLDWHAFVWNATWRWGDNQGMTWQIDLALWLMLPVFLVTLFRRRPWPGLAGAMPATDRRVLAAFLLMTLAVMGWLQTPSAFWVYDVVPGAALLQFSWRLLAFLTVAMLVCAGIALAEIADALGARFGKKGIAAALLLATALTLSTAEAKMWWHKLRTDWYAPEWIAGMFAFNDYWAFGEFLPKVDWVTGHGPYDAERQTIEWIDTRPAQACTVAASSRDDMGPEKERKAGHWTVTCAVAQNARLPVFLAPGMTVYLQHPASPHDTWQRVVPGRTCSDPRLSVRVAAGTSTVRVKFPTWASASAAVFRRPPFDFRRDCSTESVRSAR